MAGVMAGKPAYARGRVAWIDHLRWTVIAMVVLVHACVTYSGLGSWYYTEPAELDPGEKLAFWMYLAFSQAFFMGLLFFLSAVFVPGSFDRKGLVKFVGERARRLGVPALFFMLVLDPLTVLIREAGTGRLGSLGSTLGRYPRYLARGEFLGASGPLWFAVALLGFSLVYALVRAAAGAVASASRPAVPLTPNLVHREAAMLIAAMAAGSFLVRLVLPIGTSWYNLQLCFFPQYLAMFLAGLWAGRRGFLQALPREAGMTWLRLALLVGVPAWFILLGLGGARSGGERSFTGGMHWQAAGYAAWESFFCVSVSLGLLTLYRERANARARLTGLLADHSFGVYVFHAPILVGVSMVLRSAALYPLAKAAVAAGVAFGLSLGVAWLIKRVPALGAVLA